MHGFCRCNNMFHDFCLSKWNKTHVRYNKTLSCFMGKCNSWWTLMQTMALLIVQFFHNFGQWQCRITPTLCHFYVPVPNETDLIWLFVVLCNRLYISKALDCFSLVKRMVKIIAVSQKPPWTHWILCFQAISSFVFLNTSTNPLGTSLMTLPVA